METIDLNEIAKNLCYYDLNNPDCTMDKDDLQEHKEMIERKIKKRGTPYYCSCDNCFYGRTELAQIIINQINK